MLRSFTLIVLAGCILISGNANAAILKLIQSGTLQSTGNGTVSVTITEVDMASSFLVFQSRHNSNRPPGSTLLGKLASSTTLEFIRQTNESGIIDVQWYVVEFDSGVAVQRGDSIQSSSTLDITLGTSLANTSGAFVLHSKVAANGDSSFSNDDPVFAVLTSNTNLQISAAAANANHQVHWQVVEFTDGLMTVQTGRDSLNRRNQLTTTDNFGTAVNLASTMLLSGFISGDNGPDIDERLMAAEFEDSDTVRFTRGDNGGDDIDEIRYQVIEFSDGTSVQSDSLTFAPGESQKTVTISSVDTARSMALSTVQIMGGQNMGYTLESADDIIGESAFTLSLTSSTSLVVERTASGSSSTLVWQVVEFNNAVGGGAGAESRCEEVYSGGIQVGSDSATVEFEDSAQLLANSGSILGTPTINKNTGSSCGASQCTASGTANKSLNPPVFQYTSSTSELSFNDNQTVGDSGDTEYKLIEVKRNGVLTFSASESIYIIDVLQVEDDAVINFTAGDYFIKNFDVDKKRLSINVIGSGTARIWSTGDIKFKEDALINSPSTGTAGTPSKLLISTEADIKVEKDATVSAFLSAGLDLELKGDSSVFGAVTANNKVKLKDNAVLTYVDGELSVTDFGGACNNDPVGGSLDHFVVSHDGSGINCLAEAVGITVIDALGDTVDTYNEEITLDTQSGKGNWLLSSGNGTLSDQVINDGMATYLFDETDDGVASFSLVYEEGSESIDIDIFQTSDSLLRDDDSESSLLFSPSGFTFTQSELTNPPPVTISDPILTQIAGSNFNVHITAYGQTPEDPVCGVIESYEGSKSLSFWFNYVDPISGTLMPTLDSNSISATESGASGQTVNFVAGKTSLVAKYKDVGRIQLHGKDVSIAGSTNSFVVRPSDFVITDIETALSVDNPSANDATGPGFVAAGENFTLVLEVRDAEGSRTPNFGNEQSGEALEIVASALVVPLTGRNGAADDGVIANGSTFVAVAPAGTFRASTLSYDEYGIIRLQASIADDDYLGTGEITGTESANVGRFYPAEFTLASGAVTGACSGFTYMDQAAISVSFDLEARGAAGNVLFNYDLARLGSTGVAVPQFHAENDNQGIDLIGRTSLTPSSWNDGHFVLSSSTEGFSRLSTPDGPFDTLQLGLSINDMLDGIAITSPDMNPDTSTDCAVLGNCDAKKLGGPTGIRYGRLEVMNSFGPETEPLDIKMKANYFDDNGNFTTNTSDSCTGYINSGVTLSNYQGGLPSLTVPSPASVNLLTNGLALPGATVVLSAPGVHNDGSVEVSYDAPSWLEYDWNGSGNEDPKGTASFGHFRGHDRVIYWREVLD